MDWIFFGDDFGAHSSTTQHLACNLPKDDRIIWINSIGMRSPGLNSKDVGRVIHKAKNMFLGAPSPQKAEKWPAQLRAVLNPRVLPFHKNTHVRKINRAAIMVALRSALEQHRFESPVVVTSNPVAVYYLPRQAGPVAYLRLDDYERLPGVDRDLVRMCEQKMIDRADVVLATAKGLLVDGAAASKCVYIEQGVDWDHFARQVRCADSSKRTLGFFGLIAEWIDFDLILDSAKALEDWNFVLVGAVRQIDPRLARQPNVELAGPVPYDELPEMIAGWNAAWVPFKVDTLTKSVNPLKLRESLAVGLPTLVTPLPEAVGLSDDVHVVNSATQVKEALEVIVEGDSLEARRACSRSVEGCGWTGRAAVLRESLHELG